MSSKALIGCTGAYFVAAELSRRGWIALLTTRNTRAIDILATKEGKQREIQVKTRFKSRSRRWLLSSRAEKLVSPNLFYVFVNLLEENERPEYYVVPSKVVADYVTKTHKIFLQKGGRDSSMRQFPNRHQPLYTEV
jgi:hypothetical protein